MATASSATITNRFGGSTDFYDFSTAGNATITTNNGGATYFHDNADGGTAQFITAGTGFVDFSGSLGPNGDGRIAAGSIGGSGFYYIGAGNTLVVGGNNLSTEVSGVIADYNPCGCFPGIGNLEKAGTGKYAGLSSYLAGVSALDLVTVPHPAIPNLAAIPTGPLPPNPADLLSSHKLADAIAELRTKYKFVVIDSPPIMAATDAVILSVQADGVLLVVRSGETPKEAFTRTCDLLTSVKSRLLGVVLNAVDASAPDYYYSYRYYPYSYGYGPQEAAEAPHEEDSESIAARVSRDRDDDSQAL